MFRAAYRCVQIDGAKARGISWGEYVKSGQDPTCVAELVVFCGSRKGCDTHCNIVLNYHDHPTPCQAHAIHLAAMPPMQNGGGYVGGRGSGDGPWNRW